MRRALLLIAVLLVGMVRPGETQTFTSEDPVLQRIWTEGTERSQLQRLAQVLLDSIGPRLNASPLHRGGSDWLISTYSGWGIDARAEPYGTWRSWRRGVSHVDLLEPRVRSLQSMLLAWSPGTPGPVEGGVLLLPNVRNRAEFEAWLPQVRGNYVGISFPMPSCRPDSNWEQWATPESLERMRQDRARAATAWNASVTAIGLQTGDLQARLEQAGAVGILSSNWPNAWATQRIFNGLTERIPVVDVSCEDYGLLMRLAENRQNPRLRVNADAEWLGEVPAFNTVAEIRGAELPDEYVILSAHFDTWDGGSGATDNGTGTVLMMEAMRILREVYPNPRRTILAAHWGGEEQGLNGSRAFVQDNPHIVQGVQVLLNQDNGTGRVVTISMQGFTGAAEHFQRWLPQLPSEITRHIQLEVPGVPQVGSTDHSSFVCAGAPAFNLSALSWDYSTYTWHTQLDTFDKIVFDDLRNNALLVAMLAYLAAEGERMPRTQRADLPPTPGGQPGRWPECQPPARSWGESPRVR